MDSLLSYGLIFIIMIGEGTIVIGTFVPGFNTAITAAFLASSGRLDLSLVFISVWLGIFGADYIGYLIGRHGVDRLAAVRRVVRRVQPRVDELLTQHRRLLNLYQFVGFARTPLPIFLGAARWPVHRWTFLLLRATSLLTISLVLGSYWLGNVVGEKNALRLAAISQIIGITIALILTIKYFLVYRRNRRHAE